MSKKIQKRMQIVLAATLGTVIVTTAIAVPIAILNKNKNNNLKAMWDKKLPDTFYVTSTPYISSLGKYTTDVTKAAGYKLEVLPQNAVPPKPNQNDKITVDGKELSSEYIWRFTTRLPVEPIYKTSGTNRYTLDYTKGKNYRLPVIEEKPTIDGIPIGASTGGDAYDASKWTWKQIHNGTPGKDAMHEVKPKILNIAIQGVGGGSPYHWSNWIWVQKIAPTTSSNGRWVAKYGGTEIPTLVYDGPTIPTGAPNGFSIANDYHPGNSTTLISNGAPAQYVAVYNGTDINTFRLDVQYVGSKLNPAPTGAPVAFKLTTNYNAGKKQSNEVIPKGVRPDATKVGDGNSIYIDGVPYKVATEYTYLINGQDVMDISIYKKGNNYVTDPKQADGYIPAVKPPKAILYNTYKRGDTIKIDNKIYTYQ